jgi:hypothetical protein
MKHGITRCSAISHEWGGHENNDVAKGSVEIEEIDRGVRKIDYKRSTCEFVRIRIVRKFAIRIGALNSKALSSSRESARTSQSNRFYSYSTIPQGEEIGERESLYIT